MWTEAPSIQICSCCSLRMEEKVHALGHGGGRQAPTGSRAETRGPACLGMGGGGGWRAPAHCAGVMTRSHLNRQARHSRNNPKCLHSRDSRGVSTLRCSGRPAQAALTQELPSERVEVTLVSHSLTCSGSRASGCCDMGQWPPHALSKARRVRWWPVLSLGTSRLG